MSPTTSPSTSPGTVPAGLLAALRRVEVDTDAWTARIGAREVPGGSARELRAHLVGALYEVLHTGRAEPKDLGRIVRERDVEELLAPAVPHPTAPRPARLLARHPDDGSALVDFGDVRVRVPGDRVPDDLAEGEVGLLPLPAARPGLSHGFFMVDGPLGTVRSAPEGLRRLYVHAADPESAAPAWRRALEVVNAARVRYRTKALSHRDGYPRRDAIVLYLPLDAADLAHDVAAAVTGMPGVPEDTSEFAERLAPGVAVADDPRDPRPQHRELSFGEHRATLAATALVRHANGEPDLAALLAEEMRAGGARPDAPAFNTDTDTRTATDTSPRSGDRAAAA